MNTTERFSAGLNTIKGAFGKLESLVAKKPKKSAPPTAPGNTPAPVKTPAPVRTPAPANTHAPVNTPAPVNMPAAVNTTTALNTEQEAFTALNERVELQCAPGLWNKLQDSLKANFLRDERRVWRQIVAAVRAHDEAEASRLARAAGIPSEFLKS